MTNIIIYEDEGYKNFLPLAWTRPAYDLRCGINTLAEKIVRQYTKAKINYSCRYYLPGRKTMKFEKGLFINGRALAHSGFAREIPLKGPDEIIVSGEEIVAVRAFSSNFKEVRKKAKINRVKIKVIKYPWELLKESGAQIAEDRKYLQGKGARAGGSKHSSVVIYNPNDVIIEKGVEVEANTVIDARNGPVYIGKGSIIRPLTYLKGPLSIGPMCRIGGEVGESIFLGYSNKQHYGFIGHSYVGEWVNLGAGTTNSDLKNNYGMIKVEVAGKIVNTKEKFVGCFIGDHAKTGIGTLITTGAVIGIAANIFGGGITPKLVPSFTWGMKETYDIQKMLDTARIAMGRRGKKFSEKEIDLLRKIFELTRTDRAGA